MRIIRWLAATTLAVTIGAAAAAEAAGKRNETARRYQGRVCRRGGKFLADGSKFDSGVAAGAK